MAKKRHTAEQIIARLREAEVLLAKGSKMPPVCRKLGITEHIDYLWKTRQWTGPNTAFPVPFSA